MNKAYYVDKWEDEEAFRLFQLHLARVKLAKPTISKEFYKAPPHPPNGNRLYKLGEKHRVARDNKALGTRLCSIKLNKGEFGKMLDEARQKKKIIHKKRQDIKRELEQRLLHEENLKLLQRLIEAKPFCKRSTWKKDRERIDHFLKVRQKQRVIPLRFRTRSQRQQAMTLAIEKSTRRRKVLAKRDEVRKKGLYEAAPITPPLLKDYLDISEKPVPKKKKKSSTRSGIEAKVETMDKALQQEIKAKRKCKAVRKTPRPPNAKSKVVSESPRAKRVSNKRKPKQFHYTRLPKEYFTDAKDKPDDEEIRKQLQQKPTYSEQQTTAARLIQKTIRTRLATEVKPVPLRERVAARKIQANVRHTLHRKRQAKHHAATKIQSSLRGKLERKNMSFRKEIQKQDVAARRIQAHVRKSLSNRSIGSDIEQACSQESAEIQADPSEAPEDETIESSENVEITDCSDKPQEDTIEMKNTEREEANFEDEQPLAVLADEEIEPLQVEATTSEIVQADQGEGSEPDNDEVEQDGEDVKVHEDDEFITVVRSLSREWTDNVLKSSLVGVLQEHPMTIREFAERWWSRTMAELDSKRAIG